MSKRRAPQSSTETSSMPCGSTTSCRSDPLVNSKSALRILDVAGILGATRPTLRHVPRDCRYLRASVLARALASTVWLSAAADVSADQHFQYEQAWAELVCLPKAVLTPAPRPGKRHKRAQENHTRCRLQRRLGGEKEQLWLEAARPACWRRANTGRHALLWFPEALRNTQELRGRLSTASTRKAWTAIGHPRDVFRRISLTRIRSWLR